MYDEFPLDLRSTPVQTSALSVIVRSVDVNIMEPTFYRGLMYKETGAREGFTEPLFV